MKGSGPAVLTALLALAACRGQEPAPVASPSNEAEQAAENAAPAEPAPGPPGPAAGPAATATTERPMSSSGYRLIGTEPFWGGTVAATEIVYSTPDNQQGDRIAVTAVYGPNGEVYTGSLAGQPFVLTLTAGPCSDGMSDNVHAYTARLQVGDETRQGCADPRRG